MTRITEFLRNLKRDTRGSTVIETAIVAPVLLVMSLGTFDVTQMIARQHHLQGGASDVESIVLAVASGQGTNESTVKTAIVNSLGLSENEVTIERVYRCNFQTTLSTTLACTTGQKVSTYVRVTLTDTYTPSWTEFGVGSPMNYQIVRTVQVS